MSVNILKPDYLFEVSWEVCNKVGGIHTVIATKSISLLKEYESNYIAIGPDLVHELEENPEFIPDPQLFSSWRHTAEAEGLRVKVGRWNIIGKPIAFLVDFSDFFNKKDQIFSKLWEEYVLDSISGQWDYIEPALFGFAVGKVIESFVKYNLSSREKVVAHFHEWMTGTGILYLKKALPQVGTTFTTHATVLGRAIAGNNRPLYSQLNSFVVDEVVKEFNVLSKYSLEKISAREADSFTTVSEITAKECSVFLGKNPDLISPNGFEDTIIPIEPQFTEKRNIAREKLLSVASTIISQKLPDDTFIISTSGRYEFHNKGIDLFIDSLVELSRKKLDRPIVAFLLIPANHYGARRDLIASLEKNSYKTEGSKFLTHQLHDAEFDLILKRIKHHGFTNNADEKVKIIYVPSYLNGNDGVFNLPYYDILIGCDQTIYPSYYEPWGYTPLESLAFSIPTITTSLAGIGRWIKDECKSFCQGITIIERTDTNDEEVITQIANSVLSVYLLNDKEILAIRSGSFQLSKSALWRSLLFYYKQAYSIALQKVTLRSDEFVEIEERQAEQIHEQIQPLTNQPKWNRIIVRSKLPKGLDQLSEISNNIWWTWDDDAQELFEVIDPKVWRASDFNPSIVFEQVPFKRLQELSKDKNYIAKLDAVYKRFKEYIAGANDLTSPRIAYFSMEFGFHDSLKLYSGGLGILAGDYLKEASDHKVNLVAVSLLYRYGYFSQMLTFLGEQQAIYDHQHFTKMPLKPIRDNNDEIVTVQIMLPGRIMYARIWKLMVGRLEMYLLDTDFEKNAVEDRSVSHQLYGGDKENRLKQELLLGVGGIRALEAVGIKPDLYHSNEGHSAFIGLERIRDLVHNQQLTFAEAQEIVRASTLFTTHTPVPAGHDHFEEDLLRKYLGHYPGRLSITWEKFMALGRANPNDWKEEFNMSYLAAHLAQDINGVSMLHGVVTRDMFTCLWPGFLAEELHVGYVTNGVHWSTWTAPAWKKVYQELFEGNFVDNQSNQDFWNRIYDIDDKRIWDIKQNLRTRLISAVKERFKENWIKRHEDPKQIISINNTLSDKVLTIVFARRFATYKRAHLLFRNPERLAKILNNPKMPVQIFFAGKAHPADNAGQELIKMIVEFSKRPEFLGKILFLQNYSIGLAKLLVSGADIWLNTPTRPLEASGTSGEKAVMNGTLHFSVLDGWWVEGYQPDAGWALTNERAYDNPQFQDDLDAEIIYSMLESEILPAFYNRNSDGISTEWVKYIKNTIAGVSPRFTTRRMINDYVSKYYNKLYERSAKVNANYFETAKRISSWKKRMLRAWENIEVLDIKLFDKSVESIDSGTEYPAQVTLDLNEISPEHVGVELVVTENMLELVSIQQFSLTSTDGGKAVFETKVQSDRSGTFSYGIRIYPVHELLPHRQDFGLLKWI
jgi:phosphorylase/glycogen(starch) synthase